MRSSAVVLVLLSACELQPAPKIQQKDLVTAGSAAPSAPPAPTIEPAPQQPVAPAQPDMITDTGSIIPPSPMKRPFQTTTTCNDIGVKVADMLIAEARDAAQKEVLEGEKTRIVRRTAETCTRDSWPQKSIDCFLKASTAIQMQDCGKDLAAPAPEGNEQQKARRAD